DIVKLKNKENKVKALVLSSNEKSTYIYFDINNNNLDSLNLKGIFHENMNLVLFFDENKINGPINILGSTIASYLKEPYISLPLILHGKVIIIDYKGDMDEEK